MVHKDFLRIYVLWSPDSEEGRRVAELLVGHFDGLGMERDGVAIRVPVRFRSVPWQGESNPPRDIDLDGADHNVIVLLHDSLLAESADIWDQFVSNIRKKFADRLNADAYIPFGSPDRDSALPSDERDHIQYARRDKWLKVLPSQAERDSRLLLHLLLSIRKHLKRFYSPGAADEPLFVSHAKADGDTTARAIVDYVNDTQNDVPLQTFYDAMELSPGEDYEERFREEINRGTLLAITSDVYDSRPWCVFELTTAKRGYRPIVLADVGLVRTSRTYPYGANLPKVRLAVTTNPGWIEHLLVQTLSEGLRCDIFGAQAQKRAIQCGLTSAIFTPRPPELFDLTVGDGTASIMVYPDPPVGTIEAEILQAALRSSGRSLEFMTLSELR